jgi:hypothetical protein
VLAADPAFYQQGSMDYQELGAFQGAL